MSAQINTEFPPKRLTSRKRTEVVKIEPSQEAGSQRDAELLFPRIKLFFDAVDFVIDRATHSILNSKILLLVLLGLFVLICELVRFGVFIVVGR